MPLFSPRQKYGFLMTRLKCFDCIIQVADLQGALDRSMSVGSTSREEYLATKRRVDELNSELARLKGQVRNCEIYTFLM